MASRADGDRHRRVFGACPLPGSRYDRILLGHGSGGWLTADLIQRLFVPAFGNDVLAALEDQATVRLGRRQRREAPPRIAFTTDSFVVRPLFFPGGDIGRLAVHGTVNDLAVGGARPLFLSAAFILEEGLALADLKRIVASMRARLRRGRRRAGHRRHQGRRSRQGRPGLHHHLRHRPGARGPLALDPRRPARRPHPRFGDDRRPRHRHHVGARGDRVRDRAGKRLRPAHRPGPRRCSRRARRFARMRDPTRGGVSSALNELADGVARRRPARRVGASRSAPRSAAPARCSGSTRSTSPTKGS